MSLICRCCQVASERLAELAMVKLQVFALMSSGSVGEGCSSASIGGYWSASAWLTEALASASVYGSALAISGSSASAL